MRREATLAPVPEQMWQGFAQSRCRCGGGGPSPGADVAGLAADGDRCPAESPHIGEVPPCKGES
jgi:hypothetical protein